MISKHVKVLLSALLLTSIVSGCTLVPGSKLTGQTTAGSWVTDSSDDYKSEVEFIQITPDTIRKLNKPKPTAKPNPQELKEALAEYEYKIGVNDVLNIVVYEHPEITIPGGSNSQNYSTVQGL